MVNNLNDGLAWGLFPVCSRSVPGLFPVLFAAGLPVAQIAVLAALYPAVWVGQLVTDTPSDRVGGQPLITAGMLLQAGALALVAAGDSFGVWAMPYCSAPAPAPLPCGCTAPPREADAPAD